MIIFPPKILLPNSNADFKKWAVVACDQFTSKPSYWKELSNYIGEAPSTLNFILPEVYLKEDNSQSIVKINTAIDKAISHGVIKEMPSGFILVCRSNENFERRLGLVAALDLEEYSYKDADKSLIRATEGTVLERLPPRVKIREKAKAEFPHIMVLFDDREDKILPELYEKRANLPPLYNFELNMRGGNIEGWFVENTAPLIEKFEKLLNKELLVSKYGTDEKILFAVGDGNHSLAAAKQIWEKTKQGLSEEEKQTHPARYALCELVNIYDRGIKFEPIHRFVKSDEPEKLIQNLQNASAKFSSQNQISVWCGGITYKINVPQSTAECYKFIQDFLNGEKLLYLDYIHGYKDLQTLAEEENGIALFMPKLKKEDLFPYVLKFGALPKKTFSMGEAIDKRYYLEGKKI